MQLGDLDALEDQVALAVEPHRSVDGRGEQHLERLHEEALVHDAGGERPEVDAHRGLTRDAGHDGRLRETQEHLGALGEVAREVADETAGLRLEEPGAPQPMEDLVEQREHHGRADGAVRGQLEEAGAGGQRDARAAAGDAHGAVDLGLHAEHRAPRLEVDPRQADGDRQRDRLAAGEAGDVDALRDLADVDVGEQVLEDAVEVVGEEVADRVDDGAPDEALEGAEDQLEDGADEEAAEVAVEVADRDLVERAQADVGVAVEALADVEGHVDGDVGGRDARAVAEGAAELGLHRDVADGDAGAEAGGDERELEGVAAADLEVLVLDAEPEEADAEDADVALVGHDRVLGEGGLVDGVAEAAAVDDAAQDVGDAAEGAVGLAVVEGALAEAEQERVVQREVFVVVALGGVVGAEGGVLGFAVGGDDVVDVEAPADGALRLPGAVSAQGDGLAVDAQLLDLLHVGDAAGDGVLAAFGHADELAERGVLAGDAGAAEVDEDVDGFGEHAVVVGRPVDGGREGVAALGVAAVAPVAERRQDGVGVEDQRGVGQRVVEAVGDHRDELDDGADAVDGAVGEEAEGEVRGEAVADDEGDAGGGLGAGQAAGHVEGAGGGEGVGVAAVRDAGGGGVDEHVEVVVVGAVAFVVVGLAGDVGALADLDVVVGEVGDDAGGRPGEDGPIRGGRVAQAEGRCGADDAVVAGDAAEDADLGAVEAGVGVDLGEGRVLEDRRALLVEDLAGDAVLEADGGVAVADAGLDGEGHLLEGRGVAQIHVGRGPVGGGVGHEYVGWRRRHVGDGRRVGQDDVAVGVDGRRLRRITRRNGQK